VNEALPLLSPDPAELQQLRWTWGIEPVWLAADQAREVGHHVILFFYLFLPSHNLVMAYEASRYPQQLDLPGHQSRNKNNINGRLAQSQP
jgi:hypothetical protein